MQHPRHADSPELLARDIEVAGDGLCDPLAVSLLSTEGPRLVKQVLIDQVGVAFDTQTDGSLDLTAEAAHSVARIIHAHDATGRAIEAAILAAFAEARRASAPAQ